MGTSTVGNGIRVLAVDDDRGVTSALKLSLGVEGYTVFEASSGNEAASLAEQLQPDIVVTDINMPGTMDGFGLIQELRTRLPDIPIVVLTGRSENIDVAAIGANFALRKPVDFEELLGALKSLA